MSFWLRENQARKATAGTPIPDATRARAAVYNSPRAITASAERINLAAATVQNRTYSAWQDEAWVAYERVGEVHFGYNFLASLLSRIRFFGASLGTANEPPSDVALDNDKGRVSKELADAVSQSVAELFAYDGPGMLRSFALNLCIPGECYLLQLPATAARPLRWGIRSVKEISVRAGSAVVTPSRTSGQEQSVLPPGTFVARIWRRHPEYSDEPDSGLLGVREEVEELLMLQRLIRAAVRSRMNAGLLYVPDGITSGMSATQTAEPPIEEPDDALTALAADSVNDPSGTFMSDLMESMTAPISNESVASAYVPMLAVGPGDLGNQIRHITFERKTDAWLADRIEKTLNRIIQGIDMPKEIVTGVGDVKYSNAVVIDEGVYKAHIEPLALVAADAFTSVYLRPALKAKGFSDEEIAQVVIWYDPAEIVTRPNSADEATQGLDRGVLSPAAWRREHGYAEADEPSEQERAQILLNKALTIPDTVLVPLFKQAFPELLKDVEDPQPAQEQPPQLQGQDSQGNGAVVQFPSQVKQAQPAADPQRTAIKQVGVN